MREIPVESPEATSLDNGLRVMAVRRPSAPVVGTILLYGAGSIRDPESLSGLAHLSEHMMFRGSERYPDGAVDELTNRLGGANNAVTTNDYAAYYFVFPRETWSTALDIEADRMSGCLMDRLAFETERSIAVEERQMLDDEPDAVVDEAVEGMAFASHPYGLPVVGVLEDLERATLEDVRGFYETWYTPGNAVLAVAGDVDPAEVLDEAAARFSGSAGRAPTSGGGEPGAEPEQTEPRAARLRCDGGIARMSIGYRCPPVSGDDSPAVDLVSAILGTGRSSRLYRRLVAGDGDVNDVSVDRMLQRHPGLMIVSAELSQEGDLRACESAILKEIAGLARDGPTPDELERAKSLWRLDRSMGRESSLGMAGYLAFWEFVGGWDSGQAYEKRVSAATAGDVARAARVYMDPEARNSVWMAPATK